MYDDLVKLGLLGADDQRDAKTMALLSFAQQIGRAGAPRLDPTPPPVDLSKAMMVYQNQMKSAMARGALKKKMEDQKKLRGLFTPPWVDPDVAQQKAEGVVDPLAETYAATGISSPDDDPESYYQDARQTLMPPALAAVKKEMGTPLGLRGVPEKWRQLIGPLAEIAPEKALNLLPQAMKTPPLDFKQRMELKRAGVKPPRLEKVYDSVTGQTGFASPQQILEANKKSPNRFRPYEKPPSPASQLAKLGRDKEFGFITKEEYEAGVKKLLSPPRTFSASKSVASATDPGKYVGEYYQDTATGKQYVRTKDGVIPFDPAKHVPQNRSYLQKQVISADRMHKLDLDITEKENAMRQVSVYLKDLKLTNQGVNRIADYVSKTFKTLFTSKRLKPEELKLAASQGRLQALLGRFRIDVVGPGVMTEYDAQRVIAALGGFPGTTQNLEVAQKLLKEILGRSIRTYKTNLHQYNRQVKLFYGKRAGYQTRELLPLANQPSANDPIGLR